MQNIRKAKLIHLNDKAVNFSAPQFTLFNIKGEEVSLNKLKGNVIFIDFWASWCGPCVASFPTMDKLIKYYKERKDIVFLFINTMEGDGNSRIETIKTVLNKYNLDFNVLMDIKKNESYEIASKFNITGLPSQFIIDKHGKVRFSLKGFDGNVDSMMEELKLMIDTILTY